jgi:DNA-directed RNA polymerase specialized sigma24 family protein
MPDSDSSPDLRVAPANDTAEGVRAVAGGVSREALAAHLARKDTQDHLAKLVRKIPWWWGTMREDARHDICVAVLEAKKTPATLGEVPAWIGGIAKNVVADAYAEHYKRKRERGTAKPEVIEEIPAPTPVTEDERPAWMIDVWLRKQVAEDPASAMTYWMLVDMGRNKKTYEDMAKKHGISEDAVKQRVHRLKEKYVDAWKKHKRMREALRAVVLILLAAAIYVILRLLFGGPPKAPEIRPDIIVVRPAPAPTPSIPDPAGPFPQPPPRNDKP